MKKEVTPESKPCKKCGIEKPIEEFARNNTNKNGRAAICKECFNARTREVRAEKINRFPF